MASCPALCIRAVASCQSVQISSSSEVQKCSRRSSDFKRLTSQACGQSWGGFVSANQGALRFWLRFLQSRRSRQACRFHSSRCAHVRSKSFFPQSRCGPTGDAEFMLGNLMNRASVTLPCVSVKIMLHTPVLTLGVIQIARNPKFPSRQQNDEAHSRSSVVSKSSRFKEFRNSANFEIEHFGVCIVFWGAARASATDRRNVFCILDARVGELLVGCS